MWLNVVILALRTVMFYGGQCPAGGGVEKVEKKQKNSFVVFCKCYKTPNESKNKMVSPNERRELGGTFVQTLRVL